MATLDELGRLTDDESADLLDRVERFRSAWKADGSTRLDGYLPPYGSRHRPVVLVQIVATDMERRAAAGQPFRAERYVNHFPQELSTADMPVELLAAEFRLRHRYTDKPALAEYQRWFPAQFDAMVAHLAQLPPLPSAGPGDHTPVAGVNPLPDPNATPGGPRPSTLNDGRRPGSPPAAPTRMSGLAVTGQVDVRAVAAANMDRLGIPYDVLPSDAPYQLVRRIGSGAFGEVFEALAPGGVKVAVKRILRSVDHPASKSEKEALEAIKGLSHPFLVKTNAYWVFDDKLVIVMELADGCLTDRIVYHQDRGLPGVPPEELIPFFEQASEALDYLHSQNVSHRDVKPENLLHQKGYAKVADFGLARLQEHAMTMVPNTVGTPAYMPPEMWQQKVSLQSDQYSLAATYVRARLGRHLFDTNVLVDMANSHINATPDLNPLPEGEKAVLLKALAKKPDDRYPSCLAFAKALRAAVLTPPPKPEPRQPREGRGMVVQTVVGALATALAVGLVLWFMIPRPDPVKPEDKNEKEKEKPLVVVQPPEKRFAECEGWEPVEKADVVQIGDKFYPRKVTRKVGPQKLIAWLIHSTPGLEISPYYMTEHKITTGVFITEWEKVATGQTVTDLRKHGGDLIRELWRKDEEGRETVSDDPFLPVLGVTVPEAMVVALSLKGKLPTHRQWQKATGVFEEGVKDGPAGPPLQVPTQFAKASPTPFEREALYKWKSERFAERHIGLGMSRTLTVGDDRVKKDISFWKIRQLVTNGQEWLAQSPQETERFELFPLPDGQRQAFVVGYGPREDNIDSASDIRTKSPRPHAWNLVEGVYAGFRIVLEPK